MSEKHKHLAGAVKTVAGDLDQLYNSIENGDCSMADIKEQITAMYEHLVCYLPQAPQAGEGCPLHK